MGAVVGAPCHLAGAEEEGLAAFRQGVVEAAEVLPCLLGAEVGVVGPVHQEGVEAVVDPWLLEVVEAVAVPSSCHLEVGVVVVGGPWTQVAVAGEGAALLLEAGEGQGVQLGGLFLQEVEGVVGVVAHHQAWRAMVVEVGAVVLELTVSLQEPEEVVAVGVVPELAGSLLSPEEEEVVAVVAVPLLWMMLC